MKGKREVERQASATEMGGEISVDGMEVER